MRAWLWVLQSCKSRSLIPHGGSGKIRYVLIPLPSPLYFLCSLASTTTPRLLHLLYLFFSVTSPVTMSKLKHISLTVSLDEARDETTKMARSSTSRAWSA